jgi:hypothetical protein
MPRKSKVMITGDEASSSSTTTAPVATDANGGEGSEATDADCIICLETIKIRGEIDSCLHQFCFDCIIKWSKVTNSCPVCKRDFVKVTECKALNGKEKKKKKPKVVKIKPKQQRVEPQVMPIPGLYAYDIRALFLHLTNMMWADEDDDSDFVDGAEEDDEFPWDLSDLGHAHAHAASPSVNLNDIYENGRHVIEILDDDDQVEVIEDDEIEFLSAPPPSSRRGPRGESLFGRVGSSSYRATPSSSSSSSSATTSLRRTNSNPSRTVPSNESRVPSSHRSLPLLFFR